MQKFKSIYILHTHVKSLWINNGQQHKQSLIPAHDCGWRSTTLVQSAKFGAAVWAAASSFKITFPLSSNCRAIKFFAAKLREQLEEMTVPDCHCDTWSSFIRESVYQPRFDLWLNLNIKFRTWQNVLFICIFLDFPFPSPFAKSSFPKN